jgi:hypothetical protein
MLEQPYAPDAVAHWQRVGHLVKLMRLHGESVSAPASRPPTFEDSDPALVVSTLGWFSGDSPWCSDALDGALARLGAGRAEYAPTQIADVGLVAAYRGWTTDLPGNLLGDAVWSADLRALAELAEAAAVAPELASLIDSRSDAAAQARARALAPGEAGNLHAGRLARLLPATSGVSN